MIQFLFIQVIYALNTKNDENEHLIARIKATHADDLEKILLDSTHKLQQCEEKLHQKMETSESRVAELTASLMATEKEKSRLHEEQVTVHGTVLLPQRENLKPEWHRV